jgi:hypothetical protein
MNKEGIGKAGKRRVFLTAAAILVLLASGGVVLAAWITRNPGGENVVPIGESATLTVGQGGAEFTAGDALNGDNAKTRVSAVTVTQSGGNAGTWRLALTEVTFKNAQEQAVTVDPSSYGIDDLYIMVAAGRDNDAGLTDAQKMAGAAKYKLAAGGISADMTGTQRFYVQVGVGEISSAGLQGLTGKSVSFKLTTV